jgi:hypothetical protein
VLWCWSLPCQSDGNWLNIENSSQLETRTSCGLTWGSFVSWIAAAMTEFSAASIAVKGGELNWWEIIFVHSNRYLHAIATNLNENMRKGRKESWSLINKPQQISLPNRKERHISLSTEGLDRKLTKQPKIKRNKILWVRSPSKKRKNDGLDELISQVSISHSLYSLLHLSFLANLFGTLRYVFFGPVSYQRDDFTMKHKHHIAG